MIRRPINIVRRFSHSHKPSFPFDSASWHKSGDYKVKINDMSNKIDNISNKIDDIHSTIDLATGVLGGCMIGAGIGLTVPIIIEVFKHFF